ncbi:MAG: pentapeptide repeat-containing protein [Pseudomonadota bacterium]
MSREDTPKISSLNKEILSRQASEFLLKCILKNDYEMWKVWRDIFLECQIENYPGDFKSEEDLRQIELRLSSPDVDDLDLSPWKGFFTMTISYQNHSKKAEDIAKVKSILYGPTFLESLNKPANEKLLRESFKKVQDSFLKIDKVLWESSIKRFFVLLNKEFPETFKVENDLSLIELRLETRNLSYKDRAEYGGWEFPFELSISISGKINFGEAKFFGRVRFDFNDGSEALFYSAKFYEIVTLSVFSYDKNLAVKALFQGSYFIGGASFLGVKFSSDANFSRCQFYSLQKVPTKDVLESEKDYSKSHISYRNDLVFKDSSFAGFVDFGYSSFFTNADFRSVKFSSSANFQNTQFWKSRVMFKNTSFEGKVTFEGVGFGKDDVLDLSEAVFKGPSAHFTKSKSSKEDKYLGLKEIKAHHTIFECPVIFDLKFQSCPDFSKTHFLKYFSIEETWLKEGRKIFEIKGSEVGKFRFLKNYFEKNGDHFKESEYFAYEMKAVEERKKEEIKKIKDERLSKSAGNCCLVTKIKTLVRKAWFCFSNKFLWELRLFLLYKENSDYGMSISKPVNGISASAILFSLSFWIFFSQEFTKKSDEKSLVFSSVNTAYFIEQENVERQQEINILTELQSLSSATEKESSGQILETPFWQILAKTSLLTINPLGSLKVAENSSSVGFIFLVGFQAILNIALLFLLALGIRNRFKLK